MCTQTWSFQNICGINVQRTIPALSRGISCSARNGTRDKVVCVVMKVSASLYFKNGFNAECTKGNSILTQTCEFLCTCKTLDYSGNFMAQLDGYVVAQMDDPRITGDEVMPCLVNEVLQGHPKMLQDRYKLHTSRVAMVTLQQAHYVTEVRGHLTYNAQLGYAVNIMLSPSKSIDLQLYWSAYAKTTTCNLSTAQATTVWVIQCAAWTAYTTGCHVNILP